MHADLDLKKKQAFWETPKGFAAVVAALALTIGAIGWVVGYSIARAPQPMFPPGTVITIPQAGNAGR
jgi:hypothetical protein